MCFSQLHLHVTQPRTIWEMVSDVCRSFEYDKFSNMADKVFQRYSVPESVFDEDTTKVLE